MQMLLSCSISTLWSCVTQGGEGSAIILQKQEKLIIPALCTLSSSSQEGIHTSLSLRPCLQFLSETLSIALCGQLMEAWQ